VHLEALPMGAGLKALATFQARAGEGPADPATAGPWPWPWRRLRLHLANLEALPMGAGLKTLATFQARAGEGPADPATAGPWPWPWRRVRLHLVRLEAPADGRRHPSGSTQGAGLKTLATFQARAGEGPADPAGSGSTRRTSKPCRWAPGSRPWRPYRPERVKARPILPRLAPWVPFPGKRGAGSGSTWCTSKPLPMGADTRPAPPRAPGSRPWRLAVLPMGAAVAPWVKIAGSVGSGRGRVPVCPGLGAGPASPGAPRSPADGRRAQDPGDLPGPADPAAADPWPWPWRRVRLHLVHLEAPADGRRHPSGFHPGRRAQDPGHLPGPRG